MTNDIKYEIINDMCKSYKKIYKMMPRLILFVYVRDPREDKDR